MNFYAQSLQKIILLKGNCGFKKLEAIDNKELNKLLKG